MSDDFVKTTYGTIGIMGLHCPCCSDFRGRKGRKRKRLNLSKLRRSRLKRMKLNMD